MQRFRRALALAASGLLLATIYGCTLLNQDPFAVISATPTSGVAPLTVQFDGSSSADPDGDALTYAWTFGDGADGAGATVSHTFVTPGQYTVALTVTDERGGRATDYQTIQVTPTGQTPTAVFSAAPTSGGTPLTVTFNAAGSSDPDGSIVLYAWNFGDGNTATGVNVLNTYATSGTYTATLTVTDDKGLTDTMTQTIVVIDGGQGGCN
jgi:PKD repeat protein